MDIEDLCSAARDPLGETQGACPFFLTRQLAETDSDIVFMPYNYLLDKRTRDSLQLQWKNAVVRQTAAMFLILFVSKLQLDDCTRLFFKPRLPMVENPKYTFICAPSPVGHPRRGAQCGEILLRRIFLRPPHSAPDECGGGGPGLQAGSFLEQSLGATQTCRGKKK